MISRVKRVGERETGKEGNPVCLASRTQVGLDGVGGEGRVLIT